VPEKPAENEKPEDKSLFRQLFTVGAVGIQFALSIFVGFGIGYYLDKFLKTFPWFTVVFLTLGIIAAFRELFRLAKRQDKNDKKDL
jgi:ATP synthase protein I